MERMGENERGGGGWEGKMGLGKHARVIHCTGSPGKRGRENCSGVDNIDRRKGRSLAFGREVRDGDNCESEQEENAISRGMGGRVNTEEIERKKGRKRIRIESVNVHSLAPQKTQRGAGAGASRHPLRREPNNWHHRKRRAVQERERRGIHYGGNRTNT
jgi:hypothetical protein